MTFEELLKKVEETKRFRHSIFGWGATYIRESFVSDKFILGWVLKHPAKGYEKANRGIIACIAPIDSKFNYQNIEYVQLTPEQLLIFREALTLRTDFFDDEE